MTSDERCAFVVALEEELLKGGVILSEWAVRISRDAEESFIGGQYLASLLTSMAGIETHLRYEYGERSSRLQDLIDRTSLVNELKSELHALRRYRNRWVHVAEPSNDSELLEDTERIDKELFEYSKRSIVALHQVLFCEQWV